MNARIFAPVLIAVVAITLQTAQAAPIYTLNTVIPISGTPPTGSSVTANFKDGVPGEVYLTIDFNQGAGSGFSLSSIGFNFANSVASTYNNTLSATVAGSIGTVGSASPVVHQYSTLYGSGAMGGDYYCVYIDTFNQLFVSGDEITFAFTSSVGGLTAADFLGLSSTTQGSYHADTYYAAALIYHSGGPYYDLAATTSVPEPSPAILAGLGLIGLLVVQRCKKGQSQMVVLSGK